MSHRESIELGGRTLTVETGKVAKQAGGSAWLEYGDSRVLVTACASPTGRDGIDFLPLTVDYQEKMSAVGRFPGGYIKRESRPQLRETLICRMIDRPIRPLFAEGYSNETQVIATVFSADTENDPDVMAIIGTSTALILSEIPFDQPIGAVRIGLVDGEFVCNPTPAQIETSRMDILVVASADAIVMVEGESREISEAEMVEGLMKGFDWIQPQIQMQRRLQQVVGKTKMQVPQKTVNEALKARVRELALPGLVRAYDTAEKLPRYKAIDKTKAAVKEALADLPDDEAPLVGEYFSAVKHDYVRDLYLKEHRRIGNRAWDQVRPISIELGILPRVHGSALFTRGETQSLVSATLGTSSDVQRLDDLMGDRTKKFLLHYNFPPYSVGEVKRMGSPGRRELGHGNLAERALAPMVPIGEDNFPYTVRLVSEILESNGSSSMASVCGGCLALMDAGVPVKKPVAGIAMGLIEGDSDAEHIILSDILGDEDHLGDMDFKVCGTADGITAIQMDLKVRGINRDTLTRALNQARDGRLHILDKMREAIAEPRTEYSTYAPRIITIKISVDRIRDVIGSGGKTIREIVEQTKCKIDVQDDGTIFIASANADDAQRAVEIIKGLTEEPEVGKIYTGPVKRLVDFGAFIEIIPGLEGLLHISEVDYKRVERMEDYMREGDVVQVKLIDTERNGKLRLSMKAMKEPPEGWEDRSANREDRGPRPPRRDEGGRDRGGRGGRR